MFQYEATLLKIIDGDTLRLNIDLGFHVTIEATVRLARINTPEIVSFTAKGIDDPAKRFIMQNLPVGSVCVAEITRTEKYGRWLADIYFQLGVSDRVKIMETPRNLNNELVRNGFAAPYDGGRK